MEKGPREMNRAGRTVYPILLMVCATHLLNDMMQSVIPAVYPLLKEKFGFTFAQIGLITLVFQLTSSLLQPVAGRLADLHPRPYSLAAGMCFTLCGLLALAAAPGFALILVSVGLIGCGSSVFHPESSRVAQLASGGRKGLAQSIFQVGRQCRKRHGAPAGRADRDSVRAGFDRLVRTGRAAGHLHPRKDRELVQTATGFGSPQARRCGGYHGARTLET